MSNFISSAFSSNNSAPTKDSGSSAEVQQILMELKQNTDSILPKLKSLVTSGKANDENVPPLINELKSALDRTSSSLDNIKGPANTEGGPSKQDIADLTAGIYKDIATTLDSVKGNSAVQSLGKLLPGIDQALNQVLIGLDTLLKGVLKLVADLLNAVAGVLRGLSLQLPLGLLGL